MNPVDRHRRLGVLISGRGSNLQALIDTTLSGDLDAAVVVVISNRPDAAGLERARRSAIEAIVVDHRGWHSRDDYDAAILQELTRRDVGLVCLAGYMRLVGPVLLSAFPNAILNIHPSLLPAFPGMNAQHQAIEHGVKVSGVTVHFVTSELDAGPIILKRTVPVIDDDTRDALADRILEVEHRAYPEAVRIVLDGGWRIDGRRFVRPADAASV
ncbi:MAG: phosphoribosylglycinamide formyltransferase [Vicinamibacterales bacterium]